MTFIFAAVVLLQQPSTMAEDSRLAKPVAIRAEARSLADVLKQFQVATGVAIEASVPLRDDLVTIYTADKPASEALTKLAAHFGWTWQASNNGYFLVQTQESRKAEESKRRELHIRDYIAVREDYRKRLSRLKTLDLKDYQRRLETLSQQLEKDPRNNELRKQIYAEYYTASLAQDPFQRFVAEVFLTVSDSKLEELARRGRIVLNYYPTAAQSPLGRGTRAAEALVDDLSKPVPPPNPKDLANEDYTPPPKPIDRSTVSSVRIAIETNRGGMWSSSAVHVAVLGKKGTVIKSSVTGLRDESQEVSAAKRELDGDNFKAPLQMSSELKQKLDWKPADENELILRMLGGFFDMDNSEPLAQNAWFLTETAKCLNMPVVADAYDTHAEMMRPQVPQGKTGAEIISSAISPKQGVSVVGGWLRVRDAEWQLSRAMTVPRRILLPLRDTYVNQGGLTFDQLAGIATRITDFQAASPVLQIAAGMEMAGPTLADVETLCMLRFWDALTPFQRRALQSGTPLDFRGLSPMARGHIVEYVYRSGRDEEGGRQGMFDDDDQELEQATPEAVPMPAAVAEEMATEEEADTEITQLLPNGPLPGASVSLEYKWRGGIGVIIGNERTAVPFAIPVSALLDFREFAKESPFLKLKGTRPAVLSSYHFSIFCSPDVTRTFNASTGTSDPIFKYGPLESLPAETLATLSQIEKKREQRRRKQEQPPPPQTATQLYSPVHN